MGYVDRKVTVDVGDLGYTTIAEGAAVTLWNTSDFIASGDTVWYRPAWGFDSDNSVGVDVVIGDTGSWPHRYGEAGWIGGDGRVNLALTLVNKGQGIASIYVNWLSAPSFG